MSRHVAGVACAMGFSLSVRAGRLSIGVGRTTFIRVKNWVWLACLLVGCFKTPGESPKPPKPVGHRASIDTASSRAECSFSCELWRALPVKSGNLAISPPGLLYGLHLPAGRPKAGSPSLELCRKWPE
jgi:hypothetical protein